MTVVTEDRLVAEGYMEQRIKSIASTGGFYILVILTVLFCTFPLIWAFGQSLLNPTARVEPDGTHNWTPFAEGEFSWTNYEIVFLEQLGMVSAITNSFIVASITTVLCVAIGASSSYVLAQFRFRLKNGLLGLILSMTMFPGIVVIVPLFVQYLFVKRITAGWFGEENAINLVNTFPGIILPYIVFNLPLTVYLLYNFFQEIPKELISAARVDGASDFQIFRKVILPLAMPGVFTTAILVFIAAWNEFLFASILLTNVDKRTIPVQLSIFTGIPPTGFVFDQALSMMAATVIVTVPLVILVLIFQRQIVSGLTAGAVKG